MKRWMTERQRKLPEEMDGSGRCSHRQALHVGSVLESTEHAEMAVHELREL